MKTAFGILCLIVCTLFMTNDVGAQNYCWGQRACSASKPCWTPAFVSAFGIDAGCEGEYEDQFPDPHPDEYVPTQYGTTCANVAAGAVGCRYGSRFIHYPTQADPCRLVARVWPIEPGCCSGPCPITNPECEPN